MLEKMWERAPLIVGEPIGVLVVAVVVATILVRTRRRGETDRPAASHAVRAGALSVVLVWGLDHLVRRLLVDNPSIAWWAFAVPIAVGALALCVRPEPRRPGTRRTGAPTAVGVRRSWSSFTDPRLLRVAVALGGVLTITTVCAGLASSPDEAGRWALLVFGDGGTTSFYGWAYGLPVLLATALLAGVVGARLRRIAAPPFPDAGVADERLRRRAASDAVVSVALGSVALAAGEVFHFLGRVGLGSVGAGIPGVGDFTWGTPYAAFAGAFEGAGWLLSVAAVVLLLGLAAGTLPTQLFGPRMPMRPRPETPVR